MPLFRSSSSAIPPTSPTEESETKDVPSSLPPPEQPRSLKKTRSWYGSFPRISKAAPITQVTIDPIQGGGTLRPKGSVDFSRYDVGRGASDTASLRSGARTPLEDKRTGKDAEINEAVGNLATTDALPRLGKSAEMTRTKGTTKKGVPAKGREENADAKWEAAKPSATETKLQRKRSAKTAGAAQVKDVRPKTPEPKAKNQDTLAKDSDDAQSTTDEILSPPMPSTPVRPSTPVGWLGWLGWGGEAQSSEPAPTPAATQENEATDDGTGPQVEPAKEDAASKETLELKEEQPKPQNSAQSPGSHEAAPPTSPTRSQTSGGGWIDYIWSFAPASASAPTDTSADAAGPAAKEEHHAPVPDAKPVDAKPPLEVAAQDASVAPTPAPKQESHAPSAGSTWAFWSRDTGSKAASGSSTPQEPGEIAVIGDSSEMHPEPADRKEIDPSPKVDKDTRTSMKDAKKQDGKREPKTDDVKKDVKKDVKREVKKEELKKEEQKEAARGPESKPSDAKSSAEPKKPKNKRSRPESLDSTIQAPSTLPPVPLGSTIIDSPIKTSLSIETPLLLKQTPPNILLPDFASTYALKDNPSISRQIGRLILRSSPVPLPGASSSSASVDASSPRVFRAKKPPRIRRAIAIGVHGLFPATYLRPMIGQPTGTSLRFASLCADGIRRWADVHGSPDCEIEKIALEGEGMIAERVDNLWKLLLNWVEHLKQADLVLLACHSQGVPVGIMLLAKLIGLGIITTARIGVCAMAGVSLGPFPYRSASMFTSSAELLEFANPQSDVSLRYEQALREILLYGARITFIGSIDDQLVPLESAVHSPAHHPYIYRAVFIDGRVHAPDFIAHLIGFALKLRNLGISDHGLIRELSSPLAGSLYTGAGHSRVYFESQVYELAIAHALETTDIPANAEPEFRRPSSGTVGVANANPYHLPWIMRGLLEEGRVKTELSEETSTLLRKFDDWNPVTTKLKDVKYKLEAIRSHL